MNYPFTEEELLALKNFIITMDRNERKLDHPFATFSLIKAFTPGFEMFDSILPWLKNQEPGTISLKDILCEFLKTRGIPEENWDKAIEALRTL